MQPLSYRWATIESSFKDLYLEKDRQGSGIFHLRSLSKMALMLWIHSPASSIMGALSVLITWWFGRPLNRKRWKIFFWLALWDMIQVWETCKEGMESKHSRVPRGSSFESASRQFTRCSFTRSIWNAIKI